MGYGAMCICFVTWTVSWSASAPSTEILSMEEMGKGLETIPVGSPNIRTANFGYNHLRVLPPYVFNNNSYKNLQKLELHQNIITNISTNAFRELRQLRMVDLSGNKLVSIEFNTFRQNHKLEKLDLSNNKIIFYPDKSFLHSTTLETLILSDNRIERVFEVTFLRLPNLRNLVMDNNYIYHIFPSCFNPLNNLQYLSLSNTSVYKLDRDMFGILPKIIDVSDTPLASQFKPPLRKIRNEAVEVLLNIENRLR